MPRSASALLVGGGQAKTQHCALVISITTVAIQKPLCVLRNNLMQQGIVSLAEPCLTLQACSVCRILSSSRCQNPSNTLAVPCCPYTLGFLAVTY
jgi:hypothetical protein